MGTVSAREKRAAWLRLAGRCLAKASAPVDRRFARVGARISI